MTNYYFYLYNTDNCVYTEWFGTDVFKDNSVNSIFFIFRNSVDKDLHTVSEQRVRRELNKQ